MTGFDNFSVPTISDIEEVAEALRADPARSELANWLNMFDLGANAIRGDGDGNVVTASDERDFVALGDGADVASGLRSADWIDGGAGDDEHWGDGGRDVLIGGAGNDYLNGGEGKDILSGGADSDELWGGRGADRLYGGAESDFLMGENGADFLDGGDGADELWGGRGKDILFGGAEDDVLLGEEGRDKLSGDDGDDYLDGGHGEDLLVGGRGRDSLDGGSGDDLLLGGKGKDYVYDQFGSDELSGGRGEDILVSRSDAGEPIPEQDPDIGQVSNDVFADADDLLIGGAGADTFMFRLDINAKAEIAAKHVDENGVINWQGVAGENGAVHDHWVDGIGNDEITDFSRAQGDQIVIEGHTVLYTLTQEEDFTLLTLYSEQGAAGAHDDDPIGTITVYGDAVTEDDIALDRMVFHGAYDTLDELVA